MKSIYKNLYSPGELIFYGSATYLRYHLILNYQLQDNKSYYSFYRLTFDQTDKFFINQLDIPIHDIYFHPHHIFLKIK